VHIDHLDPAAAEREMDALGFGARKRRHRRLLETFRALAAGVGAPGRPTSVTS
jgi:hypothetical protein